MFGYNVNDGGGVERVNAILIAVKNTIPIITKMIILIFVSMSIVESLIEGHDPFDVASLPSSVLFSFFLDRFLQSIIVVVQSLQKPIRLIVESIQNRDLTNSFLGCECRHPCTLTTKKHNNNHQLVDCWF